jgi:hypothetical protein
MHVCLLGGAWYVVEGVEEFHVIAELSGDVRAPS